MNIINQEQPFIQHLEESSNIELVQVFCDAKLLNKFSLEFVRKFIHHSGPFININGTFGAFSYTFINGIFTFLEEPEMGLGISQKNYAMSAEDSKELLELLCLTAEPALNEVQNDVQNSIHVVNASMDYANKQVKMQIDKVYMHSKESLEIFNFA